MLRLRTRIGAIASLILAALVIYGCGGIPGDAVVSVGGKAISKATFGHWLALSASSAGGASPVPDPPAYTRCVAQLQATQPKPAKGQKPPTTAALRSQCEQRYQSLKQQALDFLISAEWVLGEAEEQGVALSDAEVIRQFNQVKDQQFTKEADFQKLLTKSGQTVSDILLRIKVEKLQSKLQQKITTKAGHVSQAEVAKYYGEHSSQYGHPETRDVQLVLTSSQASAKQARAQLAAGQSFAQVAKRLSLDPVTKKTGILAGVIKGQLEQALDSAVFAARQGVLSGPVKTAFGYYVFQVKAVHQGAQQTLGQVQSQVRRTLESERSQQALTSFAKGFQKRWRAKTDCREQYVVMDCKQYKLKSSATAPPERPIQTVTTPPVKPSRPAGKKKK